MNYKESSIVKANNKITLSDSQKIKNNKLFVNFMSSDQAKKAKSNRRNTWIFLAVNIAIVAAIFIYQFCFKETKPLSALFAEKPFYRYFFIALGILFVYYLISAISYSILLKKTTGKFRFWLALQIAIVGKYWDNITPFGSGGQFAQVAHGSKKGISGDITTSIVVGKYMIGMLSFCSIGIAALCIPIDTFTSGKVIYILAAVGVGINILLTAFVWIISVNRKLCAKLVLGTIKLLHKIKIVKNYNRAKIKAIRFVKQYQKAFKCFVKSPLVFISEYITNILEWLLISSIAYMIYLAFNPTGTVSIVTILAMSFLCTFATSFIPLPGGSGAAEISFAALFSKLFTEGATFWALIFWRIFTYYIVIIIGFLFTITDQFTSRRFNKSNNHYFVRKAK